MSRLETVSFKIDTELLTQIKTYAGKSGVSEFIRAAIAEKLKFREREVNDFHKTVKQIEELNAPSLHKILSELTITTQAIFEEIEKQNEVLKLTHRRSTLSSVFTKNILDEIKKSEELSVALQSKVVEIIERELQEIKLK